MPGNYFHYVELAFGKRASSLRDAVKFMEKWGFDGLDLDYEHPHAAEKAGFANWIKELRSVFGSKYEVDHL